MKPWYWLPIAGIACLLGYEFFAAASPAYPTISALIYTLLDRHVLWGFVCGFGFGILIGHLFFPRRIAR